jgi:hypothetical protein
MKAPKVDSDGNEQRLPVVLREAPLARIWDGT